MIDLIKMLLRYDPQSGNLRWAFNRGTARTGDIAGTIETKRGCTYRRVQIAGKRFFAHHIAWLIHFGELPAGCIDHINGNGLDNRIVNLRIATVLENNRNARRPKHNTSGHIGVSWNAKDRRWVAQIGLKGNRVYLGCFTDKQNAIDAYESAKNNLGFHQNHGR